MAQPPRLGKAGNVHLNDLLCKAGILQERLSQRAPRRRPLVTVVVSLWEDDR
jgi:hypothetical protein